MSHGVIVGPVIVATAERLVFGDGTEFVLPGPLARSDLTAGTVLKIVYRVDNGSKIPLSISVLPDRRRP